MSSYIFKEWRNVIFKPYEIEYNDKCLLIMDNVASYISKESILFLEEKKNRINFNTFWFNIRISTIGHFYE